MTVLQQVAPGERRLLELHVGTLPSGTPIRIRAHVIRAEAPGPCALLLGGVHGDEINGVEIVRRAVCGDLPERLTRGSIVAIPLLNVFGFLNYARYVPDGKDVNRSFPGSAKGSLASRVAHVLTRQVLPDVTFGLDFHTGGRSHFNFPQTRHAADDAASAVLAKAFGAPAQLATNTIPKSLRRTAQRMGVAMLVYEGGENLRLHDPSIHIALTGTEQALAHYGMLDEPRHYGGGSLDTSGNAIALGEPVHFTKHSWLRARRSGLFEWRVGSGHPVREAEVIGYLRDPYGLEESAVKSPRDAFVIGHDNSPVINQGDALFHLAW